MKVKIETIPVKCRGVEIESETEEEKLILQNIWNTNGRRVLMARKPGGNIQLVIAPSPEGE